MKSLKICSSYVILLLINFLFCYKYLSRYTEYGLLVSIALLGIQILFINYRQWVVMRFEKVKLFAYGFIALLTGFVLFSHYKIDVESLNVDRWSVISSFLTEALQGNYPYYAKSHVGNHPGPMPVYFLIAMPFYLLGELSILSALGYVIFIGLLIRQIQSNNKSQILLFLLASSLFVLWEIATRSNVFTYSLIILFSLTFFLSIDKNTYNFKFFLSAILTGLLLSTRSVFILT